MTAEFCELSGHRVDDGTRLHVVLRAPEHRSGTIKRKGKREGFGHDVFACEACIVDRESKGFKFENIDRRGGW